MGSFLIAPHILAETATTTTTNFGYLDAAIILAYLLMLTLIGVYFSRRQSNLEEYFLASKTMGWLPIGMSLMAALNSGIDYVMQPSSIIIYGLVFIGGVCSWFFLYPWAAYVTIPFYRRLNVLSAYEYLETRFDGNVRTLIAVLFLAWKVGWMGTALYVPCLVLSEISGRMFQPWHLVLMMGVVVTVYTMLGGIKAVVWTEVIQFVVMLTGLAVMVGVVTYQVGGFRAIWDTAAADGKTAMVYHIPGFGDASLWHKIQLFFAEPKTLVGLLIAAVVGRMAGYTGDQVMIQRFQTSKSIKDSRQGFIINALGDSVWTIGLSFVGLGLYAYFKAKGWPAELAGDDAKDHTVPYFLRTMFPTGILGLTLAATLAASLSAIASGINSCTTVTMVDFYERLIKGKAEVPQSEMRDAREEGRKDVALSRAITVVFGLFGMALAIWVSLTGMNVIQIAQKVIQTYTGPMLAIYILGMFTRRANALGVLLGGIGGTAVALYVAFFCGYHDAAGKWHDYITFLWPTVFGFVSTVLCGYVLSLVIGSAPSPRAKELNWFAVMKRPLPEGEGGRASTGPAFPVAPAPAAAPAAQAAPVAPAP